MQIIEVMPDKIDLNSFLGDYSAAVKNFGESISATWVEERTAAISSGQEFCIGVMDRDTLKGILCFSYKDRRGYSFACWGQHEVDREGLLLLVREYANRSPKEFKLRISGLHPNIPRELMSDVCEGFGFGTKRRFEMTVRLEDAMDVPDGAIEYNTVSITKCDESALSKLDWEAYTGTDDQTLFFDSEEENRKLIKSLLSGDYGPVIADASLCVLGDTGPAAMIAVTDMGDSAFLADIAVSRETRRKGIARYLLVNAMKTAGRLKKESMVLWVSEGNTGAMALYKSLGFTVSRTGVYYLKA